MIKRQIIMFILFFLSCGILQARAEEAVMVDTGQVKCYNNTREISYPKPGQSFFGQDAEYVSSPPSYSDNDDGTVTDLNTELMWSKAVDKNKVSLIEAEKISTGMTLAGYSDWRVPNIKELYSLIDFRGYTGAMEGAKSSIPGMQYRS